MFDQKTGSKPLKTPRYTAISDDSQLATGPSQNSRYRSIDTFIGARETFLLTECDFYNSCKDNAHNGNFATYASENFLCSLVRPACFACQLSSSKPFKNNRYLQWCEHDRMFFPFEIQYILGFREWVNSQCFSLLFETVVYSRSCKPFMCSSSDLRLVNWIRLLKIRLVTALSIVE